MALQVHKLSHSGTSLRRFFDLDHLERKRE
jgi:hypothetical protein